MARTLHYGGVVAVVDRWSKYLSARDNREEQQRRRGADARNQRQRAAPLYVQ